MTTPSPSAVDYRRVDRHRPRLHGPSFAAEGLARLRRRAQTGGCRPADGLSSAAAVTPLIMDVTDNDSILRAAATVRDALEGRP